MKKMSSAESGELIEVLRNRFEANPKRHPGIEWADVLAKLEGSPKKLQSLRAMEESGGEPDVVGREKDSGEFVFVDCVKESPSGRRSVCYDRKGLESRKEHKPANDAMSLAAEMGAEMLTEGEYRELQKLGEFDLKTSSWVKTPEAIRELGGALFCDRRYGQVFTYHNGAQSYYGSRGFRAVLRV